jgi:deoxyribodipyrimidine photolyase
MSPIRPAVGLVAEQPLVLIAGKDFPAKTLPEFIAYAKANAAKLQYGSAGVGSTTHLACALLNAAAGINVIHVPYRGAGPAIADMIGGQIHYVCSNTPGALPQIQGGTVKGIALLARNRSPPGENGALARCDEFAKNGLVGYRDSRDRPDLQGTSHLHWGEISPRQIWARMALESEDPSKRDGASKFLAEIGWREFAHHLLYHFPTLPERNWRSNFDAYPWRNSTEDLKAWQRGLTGYPLVDAGMRELWQTGCMHNRVRMITASFLVKHLRIDWRQGETWFWDTLVDANLANNAAGWQWVAGSGADASPYFRIFNPMTQGRKFDPNGDYVRRWCPELARLPNQFIHAPFQAAPEVLARAGIKLGSRYPNPIVDHDQARKAALAGYDKVRAIPP